MANRIPSIKDVPTAKELGYNVVWANPASWLGPKGMPKAVVDKWSSVLKKTIESKEISDWYNKELLILIGLMEQLHETQNKCWLH